MVGELGAGLTRGELEREFVGEDFDPDEPRSGRL